MSPEYPVAQNKTDQIVYWFLIHPTEKLGFDIFKIELVSTVFASFYSKLAFSVGY